MIILEIIERKKITRNDDHVMLKIIKSLHQNNLSLVDICFWSVIFSGG